MNPTKSTKQTVYLPVEITEEFWTKWDNGEKPDYDLADVETGENIESWVNEKEGYFFTPEELNEYTQSVIKQALETAAENVHLIEYAYRDNRVTNENAGQFYFVPSYYGEDNEVEISKQSITNTFEETLKQFKV